MIINSVRDWVRQHPKAQQWLWFIALWCVGLLSVLVFTLPIKWLIKSMGS